MKKTVYIGITIIVIIAIILLCVFLGMGNKKTTQTNSNTINEKLLLNEVVNNVVNEIENDIVNNTVNNNEIIDNSSNKEENKTSTETFTEAPATAEQKAINIVKQDWKKNDKISVEGMDEKGNYVVVVRDEGTTQALAFYNVDVQNKTFTKREMN